MKGIVIKELICGYSTLLILFEGLLSNTVLILFQHLLKSFLDQIANGTDSKQQKGIPKGY